MHTVIVFTLAICSVCHASNYARSGSGRVIYLNPCSTERTGERGVCLYTWDCLKMKGIHISFCRDSSYFGSCCKLPDGIKISSGAPPALRIPPTPSSDDPLLQAATTYDWSQGPYREYPPESTPTSSEPNLLGDSESAISSATPIVYQSKPSTGQEIPSLATELHREPAPLIESNILQQNPHDSPQQELAGAASSEVLAGSPTWIIVSGADRIDRPEKTSAALAPPTSSPTDTGTLSRVNSTQCLIGAPDAPFIAPAGEAAPAVQGVSIVKDSGAATSKPEHPLSSLATLSESGTILETDEDHEAPALIASRTTATPMEQSNATQAAALDVGRSSKTDEITDVTRGTTSEAAEYDSVKAICGRPKMFVTPRIVGGGSSRFGEWPWMISLQRSYKDSWWHFSGAVLLNQHWAVTAAHCFNYVSLDRIRLVLGENDLRGRVSKPQSDGVRWVESIVTHPAYNARTYENDLALIRFQDPVTFSDNVIPICIADDNQTYVGEKAVVTGWGRLFEDGPVPSILQKVQIPIISNQECETMFLEAGFMEHLPQIFICAGLSSGGMDSCEGDSGGPLMMQDKSTGRWNLIGINSWGIGCGMRNQPGVYTRITEFIDWIRQIIVD